MFLTISKINNKRKIWNETHPTNHHRETTSLAHDSQSLFLSLLNLVLKYSYRSLSGKKSRNIYNVIQNIYWKHKISNIESEIPRHSWKIEEIAGTLFLRCDLKIPVSFKIL